MDHISESNINRQAQATTQTLGQSKIQAMHTRMMTIHPHGAVDLYDEFVTPQNWPELVLALQASAPISALIDACDQVSAKTTLAAWVLGRAKKSSPIFVTAGAAGGKQKAHCVDIDDMAHTTHDPLLAKVRYNLRRQHGAQRIGSMGITCVYSQETVKQPQTPSDGSQLGHADSTLNCHGYGSSVGVTATFGMCAASYVLEKLAKA
jgi:tRNA A37 threonylcarbamoyladenosine dehydratase